ncbi:type II toxin-antitoxin system VapC family toxin [Algoriphagus antarcticus]|uniref:PIN domain-containing protein n=1 Tax=Algoriphagus antarcticus TaxID=238540 RepID=A0A3E0DQW8_9BACT|nr:PIN domain-containing protein [Algoriphagus antarcticus]REG84732.1 PIN domain-containing protein [Algoriphagus antarcticus]
MNVFLDTNILLDFLTNRHPLSLSQEALEVFELGESGRINLFTSSHSVGTTHYLLKKYTDEIELRKTLDELSDLVTVLDVTQAIVKIALKSTHKDFEDAVQMGTVESFRTIDYIITRNLKDFKSSRIPAISIRELISKL